MEIKNGFSAYAAAHPEQTAESKHILRALRIAGIDTMEELETRYRPGPEELLKIRGISTKRLERIEDILRFYEAMAPPGIEGTEENKKFAQEPLRNGTKKEVSFNEKAIT